MSAKSIEHVSPLFIFLVVLEHFIGVFAYFEVLGHKPVIKFILCLFKR